MFRARTFPVADGEWFSLHPSRCRNTLRTGRQCFGPCAFERRNFKPAGASPPATRRKDTVMPKEIALKHAREDAAEGKKPSTQAGEFIREEMHALKQGSGNVHSRKQAIAIGLSEARRAGVKLGPPKRGSADIRR